MRHGKNRRIDGSGIDQRLVALDVDDHLGVFSAGDLGDPIGAGGMIGAGHADAGPKRASGVKYTWVVSGNDRAREIPGLGGTLVHVLKHGLACQRGENFTGEATGGEPGRNDAEKFTRHTR